MARRKRQNKSSTPSSQTSDKGASNKVTEEQSTPTPDAGAPTNPTTNNDPAWYARDPYLLRDAASYSFAYAYGKNYYTGFKSTPGFNTSQWAESLVDIPGICALRMKPTLGFSDGPVSPLNTSAKALYAYVRHMNSGRKNYDPADLMLYLIAVANIYSFIVFCERAYACALTYSEQNRYIPDGLIRAMSLDAGDIRSQLADYRMWLNTFINRVATFVVPADITYFNKVVFMYRDIFIENGDGNIKDQMYMYVPDGFYVFALDSDHRGMLDYRPWYDVNGGLKQWIDIKRYGEAMLAGLAGDEDASLMSGDIFKVYGDRVIRIPSLDEFVGLPLVYDPMILWQIRNTTIYATIRKAYATAASNTSYSPANINGSTWKFNSSDSTTCYPGSVWQDNNGNLISVERHVNAGTAAYGQTSTNVAILYTDKILSSELAHPMPEVVMESSRNLLHAADIPEIADIQAIATNEKYLGWISCGAYICQECDIVHLKNLTVLTWSASSISTLKLAALAAKFRYLPWMAIVSIDTNGNVTDLQYFNDINNYVILNANNIAKLHDVALLSLLYVPGVAKIS